MRASVLSRAQGVAMKMGPAAALLVGYAIDQDLPSMPLLKFQHLNRLFHFIGTEDEQASL
jgi:hypothetical protein